MRPEHIEADQSTNRLGDRAKVKGQSGLTRRELDVNEAIRRLTGSAYRDYSKRSRGLPCGMPIYQAIGGEGTAAKAALAHRVQGIGRP